MSSEAKHRVYDAVDMARNYGLGFRNGFVFGACAMLIIASMSLHFAGVRP
jgi:hypothetical protein